MTVTFILCIALALSFFLLVVSFAPEEPPEWFRRLCRAGDRLKCRLGFHKITHLRTIENTNPWIHIFGCARPGCDWQDMR
jgi:hypothetical protein